MDLGPGFCSSKQWSLIFPVKYSSFQVLSTSFHYKKKANAVKLLMHLRPLNCSLYFLFAQLDLSLCPGKSFLCMFNGFFLSVTACFLSCFLCICLTSLELGWVVVPQDSALHKNIVAKCKAPVRLVKRKQENVKRHLMYCHVTSSQLTLQQALHAN